jgi:glycosyltransferase involved in cell wall biosynthesis
MPVSRRSATLADRLRFDLALLGRSGFRRPWSAPLAYPLLAFRTIRELVRRRPRAIVVVAPPFVAPLVVLPIARLLRARVAIDIHTGALLDRRWRWAVPILAWACRRAEVAVVTLPSLAAGLQARGVDTLVVADPLPNLLVSGEASGSGDAGGGEVVAVCGWAADEPLDELCAAPRGRPWRLAITGAPRRSLETPENVELTGFLDDAAFARRLAAADAVVVLTTREDTLLSGAWEALAVERPLVLSDTQALRSTFGDGPVYVAPNAASIGAGIDAVLADRGRAAAATRALRERFGRDNDAAVGGLRRRLLPS